MNIRLGFKQKTLYYLPLLFLPLLAPTSVWRFEVTCQTRSAGALIMRGWLLPLLVHVDIYPAAIALPDFVPRHTAATFGWLPVTKHFKQCISTYVNGCMTLCKVIVNQYFYMIIV